MLSIAYCYCATPNKELRQKPQEEEQETTQEEPIQAKQFTNSPSFNNKDSIQRQPLAVTSVSPRIQGDFLGIGNPIDKIKGAIAGFAKQLPGYSLLTLILGKDPISHAPVQRNATNLIRGLLSLVPNGDNIFNNLQQSGALQKSFDWFNGEVAKLNLTGEAIKGLFSKALNSLGITDAVNPMGAFEKVKNVFVEPIGRIKNFAVSAGTKVMEFAFEGFLNRAGGAGAKVMGILRKAGGAFSSILKDPVAFCGNLVGAVRGGCQKFSGNAATHLKNGLTGWLFGALAGAGLTLPAQFDTKGIVSVVLQVLGATYSRLRGKLANKIGEPKVGRLEKAFDFLRTIVTGGLGAAWQKISEFAGNLQEMVIGGIKEWVMQSVITSAITKLISMFNPAGAIIQAAMAIYNTVMFFIERGSQIAALAEAVFNSIGTIAAGNVAGAANYVEQTIGRSLPVMISFLARLIGLGGVSEHIKNVIKKIQTPIENALNKLANFIVEKGKSLLGRDRETARQDEASANQDQKPKQGVITDFEVQQPFSMSSEQHRIIAISKKSKFQLLIASNPQKLIPVLRKAINEVTKSNRSAEDKKYYLFVLNRCLNAAQDVEYDVKRDTNSILKGVKNNPTAERLALEQETKRRLAEIANQLQLITDKAGITSLEEFYKEPPLERYIPGSDQTEIGKFIRGKLYDQMHKWSDVRDKVRNEEKPELIDKVKKAQQNPNQQRWTKLKDNGLVKKDADINTYDPEKVDYHVDHIEPVSVRWNNKGRDSDDSERFNELTERANLRLVTAEYNTSKGSEFEGSGRVKYLPHVGPNFTSVIAEGGMKGALKIDGKPFLDAARKPLV